MVHESGGEISLSPFECKLTNSSLQCQFREVSGTNGCDFLFVTGVALKRIDICLTTVCWKQY